MKMVGRVLEKWFNFGLWLVALAFAVFLSGLGGLIVKDLPKVEHPLKLEGFLDHGRDEQLKMQIQTHELSVEKLSRRVENLRTQIDATQEIYDATNKSFNNWLKSRAVTQNEKHNPEVMQRTSQLDALNDQIGNLKKERRALDTEIADIRTKVSTLQNDRTKLESDAMERLEKASWTLQLRVFLYRLLLTLPILVSSLFLMKKRKSSYWPFIWGYFYFALFTFFVELVPYLPSYGGYIRYIVGIILTVVIGQYGINALKRYLERVKEDEKKSLNQIKENLAYDKVLIQLSKKACPRCERAIDLTDVTLNHCPHCGIQVYKPCPHCQCRISAFTPFCRSCGTASS
jgi:outer membrane murein-binding lipoprotein Lpp